jgi:hypothetical protein
VAWLCPLEGGYCLGVDSETLINNFRVVKFTILPCVYDELSHLELLRDVIDTILPELFTIPKMALEKLASVGPDIVKNFFSMIHEVAPFIVSHLLVVPD